MQSSGILTNQAKNTKYNLHNNPSFSGHARAVAVEGPFGRENATQVWLETSHNYSVGRNSFKPLTLAVWGRRNPQASLRNNNGEVRLSIGTGLSKSVIFTETEWTFKTVQIIPNNTYSDFQLFLRNVENYGFQYVIIVTQEAMPFFEFNPDNRPDFQTRRDSLDRIGTLYDILITGII
ncbi:MAG: hypothetical protein FWE36_08700 [Erysipelotrichales bacterium]|nr:hypothetical protein [Erysipelotrichales bacterium]